MISKKKDLNVPANHDLIGIFGNEATAVEALIQHLFLDAKSDYGHVPEEDLKVAEESLKSAGTFLEFKKVLNEFFNIFETLCVKETDKEYFGGYNIQEIEVNEFVNKSLVDFSNW